MLGSLHVAAYYSVCQRVLGSLHVAAYCSVCQHVLGSQVWHFVLLGPAIDALLVSVVVMVSTLTIWTQYTPFRCLAKCITLRTQTVNLYVCVRGCVCVWMNVCVNECVSVCVRLCMCECGVLWSLVAERFVLPSVGMMPSHYFPSKNVMVIHLTSSLHQSVLLRVSSPAPGGCIHWLIAPA